MHGREDVGEASVGGANRGDFQYEIYSDNFGEFAASRRFAFLLHAKLVEDWDVQDVPEAGPVSGHHLALCRSQPRLDGLEPV